ncbi:MAG: hypothetical protein H7249_09095 [Chitinophagaceae bacterium]|nr:hypothetical protein [Oligoflexus sp.]
MHRSKYLALLTMAAVQTGCLSTLLGTKESRSKNYRMPAPGAGWEAIDPAEADAAYRNKVDKAILNVSSVCAEERFRSLEDLSTDVLKQLPDYSVISPGQATNVDGHPALITEVRGAVDGEPLSVRLAVIRTQECVYDIILAGSTLDPSSRTGFDKALTGFHDGTKQ